MKNLQFAMEEDTLYSPLSPDVIDISSNSDSEFLVEPGNVPQLLDRFRASTADGNPLSAVEDPPRHYCSPLKETGNLLKM